MNTIQSLSNQIIDDDQEMVKGSSAIAKSNVTEQDIKRQENQVERYTRQQT